GVSMMVDLKVMAYFKISLSTRNWDIAIFMPAFFISAYVCGAQPAHAGIALRPSPQLGSVIAIPF
ncbi:hypothetical protein BSP75_06910, partial [Aeromonas sp. YN13HZO-058]|uniref:hypothetical protein n=1 Tax=Aeromonas sp. YN13HZO-058 TaxID=1921564 RepID=UPI000962861C